jgi:hypothetical protein
MLDDTYSRVRIDRNLSVKFPIQNGLKQGEVSSLLLSEFGLEYATGSVQEQKEGMKLMGHNS